MPAKNTIPKMTGAIITASDWEGLALEVPPAPKVGETDGKTDGIIVGEKVGKKDGLAVGKTDGQGEKIIFAVGLKLGIKAAGCKVGW